MKRNHITVSIEEHYLQNASVVEKMLDVSERYRHDGQPSWADSYGLKRWMFTVFDRLGKTRTMVALPEPGVLYYRIGAPFFKPWGFGMTPELVYLAVGVLNAFDSKKMDVTLTFRGRSIFIPYEAVHRFCSSMFIIADQYKARVREFIIAMNPSILEEDAPLVGEHLGKVKRVLH